MHDIVSEIRAGNLKAFKELFNDYYVMLCVFANRYLNDDEQSKDVAQEAFVEYWERREEFDDIYKVKGYLYTVTRNRCLNLLRHDKVSREYAEMMSNDVETASVFEDWVVEQETYLLVRKAVDALPDQMRRVIHYTLKGLKNSEIAGELGIGEGTVKALKQTAYKKLRTQLKEYFYVLMLL